MPTPRFTTQMSVTAGRSAPPGRSDSTSWIGGTVGNITGFINASYEIVLDSGESVVASSTLDSAIVIGDRVWVTKGGGEPLIVAMQ